VSPGGGGRAVVLVRGGLGGHRPHPGAGPRHAGPDGQTRGGHRGTGRRRCGTGGGAWCTAWPTPPAGLLVLPGAGGASGGGGAALVAVEVELTPKRLPAYRRILRWYGGALDVDRG
jgi:hypothetical protein